MFNLDFTTSSEPASGLPFFWFTVNSLLTHVPTIVTLSRTPDLRCFLFYLLWVNELPSRLSHNDAIHLVEDRLHKTIIG